MARKKRTIIDETLPDNTTVLPGFNSDGTDAAGLSVDDLDLPDIEDETLQGLMSRLKGAGDYLVKVHQVTARGSEFRFNVDDLDSLDESYLQEACGPGKYAIRIYKNGIPRKPIFLTIGPKPTTPGAVVANPQADMAALQVQMMRDQMSFYQTLLLNFISKDSKPTATPFSELVEGMSRMQGMNTQNNSIDTLIKFMELGKSMAGNGSPDWKTELVSSVKDVAVAVAPALVTMANGGKPVNPALPAGDVASEVHNMVPDMVLKQGLKWIKAKIVSGMPVELALDWILTNRDDSTYQPFIALALRGEFQDLLNIDAELGNEPYNSWLRAALKGIKEAYAEVSDNDDTRGEAGNINDVALHAATGTTGVKI